MKESVLTLSRIFAKEHTLYGLLLHPRNPNCLNSLVRIKNTCVFYSLENRGTGTYYLHFGSSNRHYRLLITTTEELGRFRTMCLNLNMQDFEKCPTRLGSLV